MAQDELRILWKQLNHDFFPNDSMDHGDHAYEDGLLAFEDDPDVDVFLSIRSAMRKLLSDLYKEVDADPLNEHIKDYAWLVQCSNDKMDFVADVKGF